VKELVIGGVTILPGKTVQIEVPVVRLYTDTDICMPVHVIRAKTDGPTVFVSAAVHGDELNGIEIIRRLIKLKTLKISKGTLILVPMVNVYGVLNQSRYMPEFRFTRRLFTRVGGRERDPFGAVFEAVKATRSGIIIGKQNIPLVQEGDAMFHIAYFSAIYPISVLKIYK